MRFDEFYKPLSKDERKLLAEKLNSSVGYLAQIAGGHRKPSAQFCKKIEIATDSKVTRVELRPEIFL